MRNVAILLLLFVATLPTMAQRVLSLDSCRALALRNNKQMNIARLKQNVAHNTRKAVKTKYLPRIDVLGGYQYVSREISILNDNQKNLLSNIGTSAAGQLGGTLSSAINTMVGQGLISPEMATALGNMADTSLSGLQQTGNNIGEAIKDAFRTDTRNVFTASVMLSQPIYMGGGITAANKIATINEQLAANESQAKELQTVHNIDNAYWTAVSLKYKRELAESYLGLVRKLSDDVHKMIAEGVATRADGLRVDVKVNEAEMQLMQVDNGLSLSKMLICQLCGLPVSGDITLADDDEKSIQADYSFTFGDITTAMNNRAELRVLGNVVDISKQSTRIVRAGYLPQVALTAGYLTTNPSLYNGFERKFSGAWNVGVIFRMPVWNWFEGTYKIRASKTATAIAMMEYEEAREKIELQINQSRYKVREANKRLGMAEKNTVRANENLRCANFGFKEGVMDVADVMAAQTAWLQARSQEIDAVIDVKLTNLNLKNVLGEKWY